MVGIYSGIWEGHYKYHDGKQSNTSATLVFIQAGLLVVGHGHDEAGDFDIDGKFDRNNNIHWTKKYEKYTLTYNGKMDASDTVISGTWVYDKPKPNQQGGTFHLHAKKEDPADLSDSWITIITGQMHKAVSGEPSIFTPSDQNIIWKNLSLQEIHVIFNRLGPNPPQIPALLKIYYHTYKLAIQIADDSERNVKRHVFWQISLVNKFGADFAKALGDAHEIGRPGTDEDNRVDELNNAVALDYAKKHPNSDPLTATNELWKSGKLHSYRVAHPSPPRHDEL